MLIESIEKHRECLPYSIRALLSLGLLLHTRSSLMQFGYTLILQGLHLKRSQVTASTLACGGVGEANRHPGHRENVEPLPYRGLCSRVF